MEAGNYINFKFDDSKKLNIIKRYFGGESVHSICSELQIPRSTFYSSIKNIKMKVKVLCDRCFKDVEHENVHKYGSAVYCSKCCEDIEKELSGEKYLIHVTEENQFNYRVHIETF